ncbi:MAG: AAA family ATPase [Hyphomicrobiaceae bacterium]
MQLKEIHVEGYRSLKSIRVAVDPLTVLVGENGVGKSNLYRALALLQKAAEGTITEAIAEEGGLESVLWAGTRERVTQRLVLTAVFNELTYRLEIGPPGVGEPALDHEPMIRAERLTLAYRDISVVLLERKGPKLWLRDDRGTSQRFEGELLASEPALAAIRDAARYPELHLIRRTMAGWRLYHAFDTGPSSPLRRPAPALSRASLATDGHDLASVLATVTVLKQQPQSIRRAVADAFAGSELMVEVVDGQCRLALRTSEIERPFSAAELSDGTLRYLCLVGALSALRPPSFMAFNEPEASLHPELLAPLCQLVASASETSQLWIVTHSEAFADQLARASGSAPRRVVKIDGATQVTTTALGQTRPQPAAMAIAS